MSPPAAGTGTLTPDGSGGFTYTPPTNFSSTATFRYAVSDGTAPPAEADVTLTVRPVNDAPVAAADSYSGTEDEALVINAAAGLLANDSDIDSPALFASLESLPSHGSIQLGPSGNLIYVPEDDFFGADSFTYRANDGVNVSGVTTVDLRVAAVDDAPTADAPDDSGPVLHGSALPEIGGHSIIASAAAGAAAMAGALIGRAAARRTD